MENLISTISEVASNITSNIANAGAETIAKAGKVGYDIAFPNLGIYITNLRNTIHIGNFTIAYYGIIIAIAMLIGFSVVTHFAKKIKCLQKKKIPILFYPPTNPKNIVIYHIQKW